MDETITKLVNVVAALAVLGLVGVALGDNRPNCTAGERTGCPCGGGVEGVQTCNAEGSAWGACSECVAPTPPAAGGASQAAGAKEAPAKEPEGVTAACSAKLGSVTLTNKKLSAEAVGSAVEKAAAALGNCCDEAARKGAPIGKETTVRLVVGRDGKVASVANAAGKAAPLPSCIMEALREVELGAVCKPGDKKCSPATSVTVPISFEAGK